MYCSNKGGCIDDPYNTEWYYYNDSHSAEVGDWSGKYGLALVDDDGNIVVTDSSFWEVIPEDVTGMSVVFHCNDGTRAFCGIFVESNTSANYTVPDQGIYSVVCVYEQIVTSSHFTLWFIAIDSLPGRGSRG